MILIVGATGQLGGRITHQVLQDRQDVRILVRPNSPYQPLVEAGAQPVFGDLKDPLSLAPALAGIETVITTATAGQRGGEDTIESVDLAGNQHLIDAAARAGIRQFIFVSTIASEPNSPVPIFQAKGLAEARLRESGMGYTILQANGFMDVWIPLIVGLPLQQERPVVLIGEGRRRHTFVAIQDVAAFAVKAAGHPAAQDQTIVIGGPQAVSWRDILATFETILERPIPVERRAPGEQLPGLPPVVSENMAYLDTFDSLIDMGAATQTFGIKLTPLERWVRSYLVSLDIKELDTSGIG
jgi:NADH dehydrogenase